VPLSVKKLLPALLGAALVTAPVSAQTLEEMAGQMILVGFVGDSASDSGIAALRDEIAAGGIGGVMYLRTNVRSLPAVAAMNRAFLAASPDLPPFITLDQEGGAVERLTAAVGFKEIPNARTVAARNSPEGAARIYGEMAKSVAALGFTVNFGPVVDLDLNPDNQIIAKFGRSFSENPKKVIAYGQAFIEAHRRAGLLSTLKHFPGHGSSTADSHEGFVDISHTWQESELTPYRALIGAGLADMVMVGHLYHASYSSDDLQLPSSLAPEWITGVLREELGFEGVVISDDLEMGAIRAHFSLEETVVRAVRAGMDVLLFSNTAKPRASLAREIRDILLAEAEADPAFAARIEESYRRIVALKAQIGEPDAH
jgi:beta-N-acetylhexosaminidase